jgi:hypothetical protein
MDWILEFEIEFTVGNCNWFCGAGANEIGVGDIVAGGKQIPPFGRNDNAF